MRLDEGAFARLQSDRNREAAEAVCALRGAVDRDEICLGKGGGAAQLRRLRSCEQTFLRAADFWDKEDARLWAERLCQTGPSRAQALVRDALTVDVVDEAVVAMTLERLRKACLGRARGRTPGPPGWEWVFDDSQPRVAARAVSGSRLEPAEPEHSGEPPSQEPEPARLNPSCVRTDESTAADADEVASALDRLRARFAESKGDAT